MSAKVEKRTLTTAQIREAVDAGRILEERKVGSYTVQVYLEHHSLTGRWSLKGTTPVYVKLDGIKVPCFTRAEERRYPKRPAWEGTYMVREWASRLGLRIC